MPIFSVIKSKKLVNSAQKFFSLQPQRKRIMKRLIAQCKLYKGEDLNPFEAEDSNKSQFWQFEERWVRMMLNEQPTLNGYVNRYISKLGDFDPVCDCPLSLKALMFERYNHWLGGFDDETGVEDFLSFFETYMNIE